MNLLTVGLGACTEDGSSLSCHHLSTKNKPNLKLVRTCFLDAANSQQLVETDDKGIKDSSKEYMEKLMNEENEWDHKLSVEVKEWPADCIRMDEVRAALKEMKRHKAGWMDGVEFNAPLDTV